MNENITRGQDGVTIKNFGSQRPTMMAWQVYH